MEITEHNVVAELNNKNPLALEYIMDTCGKPVYALVRRILGDVGSPGDIEECVSDAFVQAWEKIGSYDSTKGSLKTWLFVLAKYKALDYRRRLGREAVAGLSEENLHSEGESVENLIIAKEQAEELIDKINGFDEPDRSILLRRYFLYESIETIAGCFGLSSGAVYKRLWRCRNVIRQSLGIKNTGREVSI